MRSLAAVAAFVAVLALPAFGQRTASHGSFAAHAAPSVHGGFASHAGSGFPGGFGPPARSAPPARFAPSTRFAPPRYSRGPVPFAPRVRAPYTGNRFATDRNRPPYEPGDRDHHRNPYFRGYGGYPYVYPGYPIFTGYVDPWLFGPDDYDSEDSYGYSTPPADAAPYAGYGAQDYGLGPETVQPQAAERRAYLPSGGSAPATEAAVMVIFKDGRPPEQIHNYLVTAHTLTVLDSQFREIPLDQVDVAATQSANRAVGVDFQIPESR